MASISVIIPTCGRAPVLRETIASLFGVLVPEAWSVEVVVIENGGRRGTEELLRQLSPPTGNFCLRYLFESAQSKSRALNSAVAQSVGDILLFTDDDIRFPANWLEEMCGPIARGEGEVVIGGCRLAAHLLRDWMTRYHRGFLGSTEYLSDTNPSEFAGANMACARTVFSRVPEFDCELGGGGLGNCEDSLFGRQVRSAGFRVVSRTKVWAIHHPPPTRLLYGGWIAAAVNGGRSEAYLWHHWSHDEVRWVLFRLAWLRAKLAIRLLFSRKRQADSEGIPAWELSYRYDISRCKQLLRERHRPRNYTRHGLRKRALDPQATDPAGIRT